MALFSKLLLVASLAGEVIAQRQITWGSVVFTYHGEKVPDLVRRNHNLTPLGAGQLYNAGNIIRARYIDNPTNGTNITDFFPINGISPKQIRNPQLDVMSLDDEYQTASAMAFMQGLYPPGIPEATYLEASNAADDSIYQYPLNGYQYPNIETVSEMDMNYIWIAGHIGCDNYAISEILYKKTSAYQNRVESTKSFYTSLIPKVFSGIVTPSIVDFRYANDLYEYALFEYTHNDTVRSGDTGFSEDDLRLLYALASEQQWSLNSPNSEGTSGALSGRTLASKVLQQFRHVIASEGFSNKLTLMFTTAEPFMSFFSAASLPNSAAGPKFKSLPLHGSTMLFELYSFANENLSENDTQPFPEYDNLHVRFLFRNGTSEASEIIAYPLFGRPNFETEMSWSDFADGMGDISLNDVGEWCNACDTVNLFCEVIKSNESGNNTRGNSPFVHSEYNNGLSPAVYGVIGAAVTLAIAILVAVILGFFGFRIHHYERNKSPGGASDLGTLRISGGGFKGAEKLASDTDLRLKGGAGATIIRHERVGSWELNDSPKSPTDGHRSLDGEIRSERVVSGASYSRRSEELRQGDVGVNPFGDPVKPADQI